MSQQNRIELAGAMEFEELGCVPSLREMARRLTDLGCSTSHTAVGGDYKALGIRAGAPPVAEDLTADHVSTYTDTKRARSRNQARFVATFFVAIRRLVWSPVRHPLRCCPRPRSSRRGRLAPLPELRERG